MADITDNGQPDETQDEEFPVCPGCGERHPPASHQVHAVFNFIMGEVVPTLSKEDALSVMCSATVTLLEQLPIRQRINILAKLSWAAGITPAVLGVMENEPAKLPGVDLSRFTPRGKAN
jgi:hypothetical protein